MPASRVFRSSTRLILAAAAVLSGSATLAQVAGGYPALSLFSADYRLVSASRWGVELGVVELPRFAHFGRPARTQGLNLSLVGRTSLFSGIGLYGRVGTTYGQTDNMAGAVPGPDAGFGLSYGAGLSMDFSPKLSATLGWDSHDLRVPGGLRATSLGLQYRY